MGSRAIYSVTENGKTTYLYGQWAAVHSLPFFFLNCIEAGKDDPDAHLPAAEKMINLQDGDRTVDRMDGSEVKAILDTFGSKADIAMHVEINMDSEMVHFEHNALCYHQPFPDFSISIEDGLCEYISAKQDVENGITGMQSAVDYRLDELLTEILIAKQEMQGPESGEDFPFDLPATPAIYSITEHGDTRWFFSKYAGTYHGALAALDGISTVKIPLDSPDHAAEYMKNLLYDYRYGPGLNSEHGRVALEITPAKALQMTGAGECALKIQLDFDNEVLTFRHYPPGIRENISISFGDAEQCMGWAVADLYDEVNATAHLERSLTEYLESYVPRQEPGMKINL